MFFSGVKFKSNDKRGGKNFYDEMKGMSVVFNNIWKF